MNTNGEFSCLILANEELTYQNCEKEKRAAELIIANKELVLQGREKELRAHELTIANTELKNARLQQKEYIISLEQMIYMVSHEVRQPVTQLLGLSNLLEKTKTSKPLTMILGYIRESIKTLDEYTKELTKFLSEMVYKNRNSA